MDSGRRRCEKCVRLQGDYVEKWQKFRIFCMIIVWEKIGDLRTWMHYVYKTRTIYRVRFLIFTAVTMKNGVFWEVVPFRSCVNRRFRWTNRLHLHGINICRQLLTLILLNIHRVPCPHNTISSSWGCCLGRYVSQYVCHLQIRFIIIINVCSFFGMGNYSDIQWSLGLISSLSCPSLFRV
jgi:hypothetical protein